MIKLDEIQYNRYMESVCNDGELRYLRSMLTKVLLEAIPTHIIVTPDTHEAQYVYSPEISALKSDLESGIERRMNEIKSHFELLKSY